MIDLISARRVVSVSRKPLWFMALTIYVVLACSAFTQAVSQTTPVITWSAPSPVTYGTSLSSIQLNASAPVAGTFAYTPALGAILSAGTQILSVTFTPTDGVNYNSATKAVSLLVNQATPVITWATSAGIQSGTALTASQLNATTTVPGTFSYTPALGSIPADGVDSLSVTFTPTNTMNYKVASKSISLIVFPIINWPTPAPIVYGTPLSAVQLNATTDLPGTFTYIPVAGTVLPVGSNSLAAQFRPTTGNFGTSIRHFITVLQATPVVTWAAPSSISYGTPITGTQLNATASVPGTFVYSPALGTTLSAGAQTLSVTFTPTDAVDYKSVTQTVGLTVNQATPIITWPAPARIVSTTALSATELDATASVAGTFSYSPGTGAFLPVGTDTLSVTFTPTDNTDYTNASASVGIVVAPPVQFIIPAPGIINSLIGTGVSGYSGDGGPAGAAELNFANGVVVDAAGDVFIADSENNVVREVNKVSGIITTVAGTGTEGYSGDGGQATSATLDSPSGLAIDAAGNIYIADTGNNAIRQLNVSTGVISTIAGDGSGNPAYLGDGGLATSAELNFPVGIAIDAAGNIYIADSQNNVIRKVAVSAGIITTFAGNGALGNAGDGGPATNAELAGPLGVAVDVSGNVYITDTFNFRIRKVLVSSGAITSIAGTGGFGYSGDGAAATSAQFSLITGIAVDGNSNVYVVDGDNSVIREITASTGNIATIAGNGTWGYSGDKGPALNAQAGLNQMAGLAVDRAGNIYLADVDNSVIRVVGSIKTTPVVTLSAAPQIVSDSVVISTFTANVSSGSGTVNFSNGQGWVSGPISVSTGVAFVSAATGVWGPGIYTVTATYSGDLLDNMASGSTLVAVTSASKATPTITWASPAPLAYGSPLTDAQLNATASVDGTFVYSPSAGSILPSGSSTLSVLFLPTDTATYNASTTSVTITVAAKSATVGPGLIATIAGNGTLGYSGDGGQATSAELGTSVAGFAVDSSKNIYIADSVNHVVREVSAATGVITTIAGNGVAGYTGDGGAAANASLNSPSGVAVDLLGTIYIADTGNHAIRKINPGTGLITTLAGNGTAGFSGDGGASGVAQLYFPLSLSVDIVGNLYIADSGNNVVREVQANTGIISTIAGNGTAAYAGDGGAALQASLNGPSGVSVDPNGNVYIADYGNNYVRVVYAAGNIPNVSNPLPGTIYSVAGGATAGSTGDGGVATGALLSNPSGVATDSSGNLFIADSGNNRIRAVFASGVLPGFSTPALGVIYTVAGTGMAGYSGDGGMAVAATLSNPTAVAVDAYGVIDVLDTNNQVVRSIGTLTKSTPSISWSAPVAISFGTPLGDAQLSATAAIPGVFSYEPATGSILPVGTTALATSFTPTDTVAYSNATASTVITVNPATPVITWATPTSVTPGTALSSIQLNATASVPGTFIYNPALGSVPAAGTDTLTVSFTPTDSIDYTSATGSVVLAVTQQTPVIAWATPPPIIFGTALSANQLNATASVPGVFTYSPGLGTILSLGNTPVTATLTPTDTLGYATATATIQVTVNTGTGPLVQLQVSPTPTAVTLSDPVNLDWEVWGVDGQTPATTRETGASLISDFTPTNSAIIQADVFGSVGYSWTGGTPISSGTGVNAETKMFGQNAGFSLTAPADTTVKTLKLYIAVFGNDQLTATLSDGSTPTFVHLSAPTQEGGNEIYSIDYRAASGGQTLTVQVVSLDSSSGVGLQAAVLQPHLPQVSILSPQVGQVYIASAGVPVDVNATQFDTPIATVTLLANGIPALSMTAAPYQTTWSAAPGHYVLQAQATDTTGLTTISSPEEIDVVGTGGNLSVSFGQLTSNVDLTSEGTADWTLFAASNFSSSVPDRKAGVVPLISNYSAIGPYSTFAFLSGAGPFSFEDGTPDPQENGILPVAFVSGFPSPGLQLVVAADTQPRTLRLYTSASGTVQMTAFLSDGSAPVITDNSLTNLTGGAASFSNSAPQPFYTINYNAASPGQTLTIRLVVQGGGGQILVNAATLTGTPTVGAPVVTSIAPSGGAVGDTVTITGSGFGASQNTSTVTLGGVPVQMTSWSAQTIQAVVPAGAQSGPVQVVTGNGASNTNVLFTMAPSVTALSPNEGPTGTAITISGSSFGSAQNSGTVFFNGVQASPISWSDTQIVVPVPSGATTGKVVVTQGLAAKATPRFVVDAGSSVTPAPVLAVHLDDTPMSVTLSDAHNQDWIVWGSDGVTPSAVRKSQANLITAVFTPDPPTMGSSAEFGGVQYSWVEGMPVASGNAVLASIEVSGVDSGIQFSAPADTTVKTLKIYSRATGNIQVNASISDGSSSAITYFSPSPNDIGERTYSIDYRANSPGQTVTVQLASVSGGPVLLEAAALLPHLPQLSILSPESGQTFPAQSTVSIGAQALQFDSSISSVGIFANGSPLSSPQPPYAVTWNPVQGHYELQAEATDANGLTNISKPVPVDIIGTGGNLSATKSAPDTSTPTDLTLEGTADWIMFGQLQRCNGNFPNAGLVRKAGVGQLISSAQVLGDSPEFSTSSNSNLNFAFEDGSPDPQASSISCGLVANNGVPAGNGFEISVNADAVPRTLHVYVGAENGQGKLKAFLSDGSAPVYLDTSVQTPQNVFEQVAEYTFRFNAAMPGQKLTVQWTLNNVNGAAFSAVALYAATLEGVPASVTGPAITRLSPTSGGVGTIVTITGTGFGVSQGSSTVTLNGMAAVASVWTDNQIQLSVPVGATSGNIVVTTSAGASDGVAYSVVPFITGLSTAAAPTGTLLTISGTSFGPAQSQSSFVIINGALTQILNWSDSQIQAYVPASATPSGTVNVFVNLVQSNGINFTVTNPSISGVAPSSGPIGTQVVITGIGFGASQGTNTVTFGGVSATVTNWTDTSLTVLVPSLPSGLTTVALPNLAANNVGFSVSAQTPVLTWTTPSSISYGTRLTTTQLNATASVPGVFVYSPPLGSMPVMGADILSASFIPTDSATYSTATSTVTLTVTQGKPGIEIPPPGMIDTLAGNGISGYTGDGGLAPEAELNQPYGIAVDAQGNLYLADTTNNVIREVNASTGIITSIAGNGTSGYTGDGGLAIGAQLSQPYGVAVDSVGNIYISDTGNNSLRMVNASTGVITTIVGDGTGLAAYSGDGGPANQARLNSPAGVAVDPSGNIYIADWLNSAVRKVTASSGVVSTIAGDGTGNASYGGDGGPAVNAQLNRPFGVAVDLAGDVYIADTFNNRIREVNASTGNISTVAGTGTAGYVGDNGPAINAQLNSPLGVAVDLTGNIYIGDWQNNAIREVSLSTGVINTLAGTGLPGFSNSGGQTDSTGASMQATVRSQTSISAHSLQPGGILHVDNSGSPATPSSNGPAFGSSLNGPSALAVDVTGTIYAADTGNSAIRGLGQPTINTPPFLVPSGQYLAWSLPQQASFSSSVNAVDNTASFFGPGDVQFFSMMKPTLPSGAVIQGIYAVEAYTASGVVNGATLTMIAAGQNFYVVFENGVGVGASENLGTTPPSVIGASMQGVASINITSAALAYCYTLPNGADHGPSGKGGAAGGQFGNPGSGNPETESLALMDPYLLPTPTLINTNEVINLLSSDTAKGIDADGTATAIAVYTTDVAEDVTFSVNNGASLAPWNPAFLTIPPPPPSTASPNSTSLIVPAANLIFDGTSYHALALVQAGTPSTSTVGSATTVNATIADFHAMNQSATASMQTLPVPVVFIHGLWGDETSLDSTRKYLLMSGAAPFGSAPQTPKFLKAICYSKFLNFDTLMPDTVKGSGAGCEVTAMEAVTKYFTDLYSNLDSQGFVGGRVDTVVHSMGGLVARKFSTLSKYLDVHNRNQGAFRTIITLDTPEIGSELPDPLIHVFADRTRSFFSDPASESIFDLACLKVSPFAGSALRGPTLAQCFASLGNPLAAEGAPLFTGAPASLIPNSVNIATLPDPNIENATWFAVVSDYPDNGQQPVSSSRWFINHLLASTYDATEPTPTLDQIFHHAENDVIVTTASQSWHAVPGNVAHFCWLSHTDLPVIGYVQTHWLPGGSSKYNNESVTKSAAVNAQVLNWLGYSQVPTVGQSTSCTANASPMLAQSVVQPQEVSNLHVTRERLNSIIPALQAEIGQPVDIPLTMTQGDIIGVDVSQRDERGGIENKLSDESSSNYRTLPSSGDGTSGVVTVVPLQVGQVDFQVTVEFADGGIARQRYSLNVAPSSHGLHKFSLNDDFDSIPIVLEDNDRYRQAWLSPVVEYDSLQYPVRLRDSSQIKFSIEQPAGEDIVSVDPNGIIHGLHPGKAVVTGEFQGMRSSVTVTVYEKDRAPQSYRRVLSETY